MRIGKFFKASRRERWVFVRAVVLVTFYRIGLSVLPFSITRAWTAGQVIPRSRPGDDHVIDEITRGVRIAGRLVPRATCLTQALAARKLLAQYGYRTELKIGVAKNTGELEAHAWLEINGRIILGKQRLHSRYSVLGPSATVTRETDIDYRQPPGRLVDEIQR
ncbi:MAG TPA: lasso peptide biosynthesis B2 protein [Pyrinomonadaceae bacterium]